MAQPDLTETRLALAVAAYRAEESERIARMTLVEALTILTANQAKG